MQSLKLFFVLIIWFNSWLFNGICLWDIVISMSKLSFVIAHPFFLIIWHVWETPDSTIASAWGIITYITSKCWMIGKATDTTQSFRRSWVVIGFSVLPTASSISVPVFLIDFFVEHLFAFYDSGLVLSECFFKKIPLKPYSFMRWCKVQGIVWSTQQFFRSTIMGIIFWNFGTI